jgi:hypothetical protein
MVIFDAVWRQYQSTKSAIGSFAPKPERKALYEQAKETYHNQYFSDEQKISQLSQLSNQVMVAWQNRNRNSPILGGTG